jgi:S-methylmethionine-dependent homocysteine/selenocysteine methylase
MENRKYSSYAAIYRDLEILKLEKQISYQKLVLSVQKTRDAITPENIVAGFLAPYKDSLPNTFRSILQTIVPYLISYFSKRKRSS